MYRNAEMGWYINVLLHLTVTQTSFVFKVRLINIKIFISVPHKYTAQRISKNNL